MGGDKDLHPPTPLLLERRRGGKEAGFASWQVLVALAVLAGVLLFVQKRRTAGDVQLATGPPSAAQSAFFHDAAERPDLDLFFKALTHAQKMAMADNLARYPSADTAKAAARLLATFDEPARQELTKALVAIAAHDPKLVAAELARTGSFEQQGLFSALESTGETGIRAAAESLKVADRRTNAIRFLVERDDKAVPFILPYLEVSEAETRAAAAEALGKLGATSAVPALLDLLAKSEGAERTALLNGLADIGDPRAEDAILQALQGGDALTEERLMAGLGRMGTARALDSLRERYREGNAEQRTAARSALILAGDKALRRVEDPDLKLAIAKGATSELSNAVIRGALGDPKREAAAADAARGREALVPDLWPTGFETRADPGANGTWARIEALATTASGRVILKRLQSDPRLGGLAQRSLKLGE